MKTPIPNSSFSKYRKYHDICEMIESMDFTEFSDQQVFEFSAIYELCTIAKTLILSLPQAINPNFLLFRKLTEDLKIMQISRDRNYFSDENYLLFRIAVENRIPHRKERYVINKNFYLPYNVIKKRVHDSDFYLSSCLGDNGTLSFLLNEDKGIGHQYRTLGILTHNFIFPADDFETKYLIELTHKLTNDCLENIRKITRKIIKANAQINFPDPTFFIESSPISQQCFINNHSILDLCIKYSNINEDINIYILKTSFITLFDFATSYVLNDYNSLVLRGKSYIEMISIFFSVISFRKKDLNNCIDAYCGLIFNSIQNESVDEYLKEIYNKTYRELLNIDFYSFKDYAGNPLYLLFLKSINFIDVARERIKGNKEIKEIYDFSCDLVHSSLQLIKYKKDMRQMAKTLFLFLTQETIELVNKIKTRVKRVVKSNDVDLSFAQCLDGLNYLYELINKTDVDIMNILQKLEEENKQN